MSVEAPSQQPLRTYEISHDQQQVLETENIAQFSSYLSTQMETHLGERFNVSLSSYRYDVRNGELWGKDMDEPFLQSLKRGRDYRNDNGEIVDRAREEAEVVGFEKIQNTLLSPDTKQGTIMLSISPPGHEGSSYLHNFYDMFVLRIDENGERYIEARRYASSLTPDEYEDKLQVFGGMDIITDDVPASFLAQPVEVSNAFTPEDLHEYLHKENRFMDEYEFARIKEECSALIAAYCEAIITHPQNDILHKTLFNAVLNKADDVATKPTRTVPQASLQEEVERYAFKPVRTVMTGCGVSAGYETSQETISSPLSVLSYGKDKYGERVFKCPTCNKENIRPYNTLLPFCQHCKSTKVAC